MLGGHRPIVAAHLGEGRSIMRCHASKTRARLKRFARFSALLSEINRRGKTETAHPPQIRGCTSFPSLTWSPGWMMTVSPCASPSSTSANRPF